MERPVYLISLKPVFARQIFEGTKKYELRRKVGRIEPGSLLLVYESAPVKALTGVIEVGRVEVLEADVVVSMIRRGELEGCDEADVEYVIGERPVLVLEVVAYKRFPRPIGLEELRRLVPGFRPPLSYIKIDKGGKYSRLLEEVKEILLNTRSTPHS